MSYATRHQRYRHARGLATWSFPSYRAWSNPLANVTRVRNLANGKQGRCVGILGGRTVKVLYDGDGASTVERISDLERIS